MNNKIRVLLPHGLFSEGYLSGLGLFGFFFLPFLETVESRNSVKIMELRRRGNVR